MGQEEPVRKFPVELLNWAGHRGGGVKRLFYTKSGRPSGEIIHTRLLTRLGEWATAIPSAVMGSPRVVLLVGGPGNGKTEAVEFTIHSIDAALGLSGVLVEALTGQFLVKDDQPAPRLAKVDVGRLSQGTHPFNVCIVQDASAGRPGRSAASLLVDDLELLLADQSGGTIYLACINRGILDDALIAAIEEQRPQVQKLLEIVVQSVGMGSDAPACWPLAGYPKVAVWPMDVETLVDSENDEVAPGGQLLALATNPALWPAQGACPAGDRCPFCTSRSLLSGEPHRTSLLKILRWYELASGKRWSFRDLFSLISFLLAGVPGDDASAASYEPCSWGAKLLDLNSRANAKPDVLRLSAPFLLVSAQYQHALFGNRPRVTMRSFRQDLKDLQLQDNATLLGFYHFLTNSRGLSVPPTLGAQLGGLAEIVDPAIADPDMYVEISSRTTIRLRDIDTRFSQSVGEGLRYIQKYRCLSALEIDLLKRLDEADLRLSDNEVARRRPAAAANLQALIRDFACRMVRRSIGVRAAVVRDSPILADFQRVISGNAQLLHDAAKQVEKLLNENERFVVTLNTTFGEPLPPVQRRVVLTTGKQKVKPREMPTGERPNVALRFLSVGSGSSVQSTALTVGSGSSVQSIPLTYELFKSVRELTAGMTPASLPRTVVALLDTTRARLAGWIVRHEESLDDGEMRIGLRKDLIVRGLDGFIVAQKDEQ